MDFTENDFCKIFDNNDFGYTKVQVEQPLVEDGQVKKDRSGKPKPDSKLRDHERIPLKDSIDEYYETEVKPHLPDSWMDQKQNKIGYEINFNKYFYQYSPLRKSKEIFEDLQKISSMIEKDLKDL